MPAAKLVRDGKTVKRPRANIPLHPDLYRRAKAAAKKAKLPLSDWAAGLMARETNWTPKE
jgi:hypothetical protein